MSGVELVLGVVVAFFVIGIAVGVIVVIAMSALRDDRTRGFRRGGDQPGADWAEPPGPGDDDDGYPRWPGGYRG